MVSKNRWVRKNRMKERGKGEGGRKKSIVLKMGTGSWKDRACLGRSVDQELIVPLRVR